MNNDAFVKNVASRLIEQIRNGTAPWQKPWRPGTTFLPFNKHDNTATVYGAFRSEHPNGASFAFADGAVRFVSQTIGNDVYWDTIKSIDSMGEQPVYDATVLECHNFIANGVSVHNSIEQDSDVVILLHREDAYEPESPRAGEADFIVAKHRNGPTATVTVAFQGHYSRFTDMARV